MPNIPQINIGGTVYKIKDAELTNEVTDLKSAITNIQEYVADNPNITFNLTPGYFINKNDGGLYSYNSTNYAATKEYIPVIPGGAYMLTAAGTGSAGYAWYTKEKEYISGDNVAFSLAKAPSNAYYIRFTNYNSSSDHSNIKFYYFNAKIDKNLYINVANNGIYYYKPPLVNGYINKNTGSFSVYGAGEYKATFDFIEVSNNYLYYISAYENGSSGYALYDDNFDYISGGVSPVIFEVPANAKYIRFTSIDNEKTHDVFIYAKNKVSDIIDFDEQLGFSGEVTFVPSLDNTAYIDKNNGSYHVYGGGTYACTDFIRVNKAILMNTTVVGSGTAGYAFYTKEKGYISGGNDSGNIVIPNNAYYIRLTDYNANSDHSNVRITFKTKFYNQFINSHGGVTIQCVGDSVTEGMGTNGAHTADYGKSPYPARLTTLLVDNGYENVVVTNCGHGGERTPDIAARIGAYACYFTEDITVPGDGSEVSLGTPVITDGLVTGTKIKTAYPDGEDDYCVYFTQESWDTNPLSINGVSYTLVVHDNTDFIKKTVADGNATTISAGTFLFTNDNRNPSVNIVYGGINDNVSLTMERWINTMQACVKANGGKAIILGPTHALWDFRWQDVTGTSAEKYAKYKKASYDAFGVHFIDLYQLFFENAMSYCLEAGYFSDKSAAEIAEMEALLDAHIIPAEFSYDKQHQGDVHLSEEGYYVIARLIFDRLKRLNYIQ